MNYAEDRLDRRARSTAEHHDATTTTTTAQELDRDLKRAHDVFHRYSSANNSSFLSSFATLNSNVTDRSGSNKTLDTNDERNGSTDDSIMRPLPSEAVHALCELREAHELAGKTLRDGGSNRQSLFHFGVAWRICHWLKKISECSNGSTQISINEKQTQCNDGHACNDKAFEADSEWRSAGDYAQMAELAGFPEVGALALLVYRAGGTLDFSPSLATLTCNKGMYSNAIDEDNRNEQENAGSMDTPKGCGCGMAECGVSPCYIAFPPTSQVLEGILRALDTIMPPFTNNDENGSNDNSKNESHLVECNKKYQQSRITLPTALEILARLSHITRKSSSADNPISTMHSFLSRREHFMEIPSILEFWDDKSLSPTSQHHDRILYRPLPPVLQLLLVKLLYSSPISGPFLRLSCYSIPYLAAMFPPSSPQGRLLAKDFKSHWAYYIFIRALVLGERVKKHRMDRKNCQSPVWDEVFCLDASNIVRQNEEEEGVSMKDMTINAEGMDCMDQAFSGYFRRILEACTKMKATISATNSSEERPNEQSSSSQSNAHSTARCNSSNNVENQHPNQPLPSIINPQTPFYTRHPPVYVVGDSHVLSLAWQTICIDPSKFSSTNMNSLASNQPIMYRTAVPFPATGMKAWHSRPNTPFFTHYNLHACLQRLSTQQQNLYQMNTSNRTIIISAGEIDCREGIGGALLQGYYQDCNDAVERTVIHYLNSISALSEEYRLQILVMPVAPHAYRSEKNGKSLGRARRRQRMMVWNETLRRELCGESNSLESLSHLTNTANKYSGVFLLDYEQKLRHPDPNSPVGYVLHPSYNADYTHVNSAVVPLVELALLDCGCDLKLI